MDELEERVRALEEFVGLASRAPSSRDLAGAADPVSTDPAAFWALLGLRRRLAGTPGGGVVFAGSVQTADGPAEWQYGLTTEALLDTDEAAANSMAGRLAALGHPVRVRLLLAVLSGRATPAELADLDGMGTTGQVYHHLRTLTAAGWLRSAGRGRLQVPAERVVPLLVALAAAR